MTKDFFLSLLGVNQYSTCSYEYRSKFLFLNLCLLFISPQTSRYLVSVSYMSVYATIYEYWWQSTFYIGILLRVL